MWVKRAAIRAIPPYARVPAQTLERVERSLSDDDPESETRLEQAFNRFEETQPALSSRVAAAPTEATPASMG